MSLEIHEKVNRLEVHAAGNNLDKELAKDIPEPLPNYSGFCMVISAPSGSGKTTLLNSIMSQKSHKGKRTSYRKVFDRVLICSPTLGNGTSLKKDPFSDLPDEQKWTEFNLDTMTEIYDMCKENHSEEEHTCVIFDDVGAQLRKNAKAEKLFISFLQNRRHIWTSVFILVQRFRDLPTGIRNNMSHFILFRPKNVNELEAIASELFPFQKKNWQQVFNHVFDCEDRFSFMMVDMSLRSTNKFRFFNKFNELIICEHETGVYN
jgi:hypothetical protein